MTTTTSATTWADGFGTWHVTVTGQRYNQARLSAIDALTTEITERNQNDILTGLELVSIDVERLTYHFTEK